MTIRNLSILFSLLTVNITFGGTSQRDDIPGFIELEDGIVIKNMTIWEDTIGYDRANAFIQSRRKHLIKSLLHPDPNYQYWIKLEIENSGNSESFLLNAGHFGYATSYLIGNNIVRFKSTGKLIPLSRRPVKDHMALLPIKLSKGTSQTILLQCSNYMPQFQPVGLAFSFISEKSYNRHNQFRLASQGLFIGCILVMALYNLFLFFGVRDISYLYYVLSIIGVGLYFTFYYGFNFEYLWPGAPRWDAYSFAVIVPLTGVARIYFTKTYLSEAIKDTFFDKALHWLQFLYVVPFLIAVAGFFDVAHKTIWSVWSIGAIGNAVLITMLLSGFYAYYKGYKPSTFFIVANLVFILGAILFIFREIGLLVDNAYTRYIVQIGVLFQVVLFSLGLAYRLNRARTEASDQRLAKEKLAREKEIEKQQYIQQQKEELEALVHLRTANLEEKQNELEKTITKLKNSEEDLLQANKIKDKLFSLIGHDMRAPLATFDSFLNLLLHHSDEIDEKNRKNLVASTQSSLQSINLLLDNLLKWSRTQLYALEPKPEITDLNAIVEKNIRLFDFNIVTKNILIRNKLPSTLYCQSDKNMADTIIRNLLNNAVKFTPKGGNIEFTGGINDEKAFLSIYNSNESMKKVHYDRIAKFDGQYKTKGTDNEEGTGLGLLLCKEFVLANKGFIHVDIAEKKGISFRIELPAAELIT
jgi:signal transduction histidine kinase